MTVKASVTPSLAASSTSTTTSTTTTANAGNDGKGNNKMARKLRV